MSQVKGTTNAPPQGVGNQPQVDNSPNPFRTSPPLKGEKVSNPESERSSKQHAAQERENKKLEGSLRKAEIDGDLKSKKSKGPTDAEIRDLKYDDNYFTDADELKAPPGTKPLEKPKAERVDKGEPKEEAALEKSKGAGTLVTLSKGQPDRPMTVTVHGIAASPATVDPLSRRASKAGDAVKTFAYNDMTQDLTKSSKELAGNLQKWMKENPGRPLRIDAHSMGGRVALAALDELNKSKEGKALLKDRKVELNLVASAINGEDSARVKAAQLAPTGLPPGGTLLKLIPGIVPGQDMAPDSAFQKRLDSITLPPNVKVRVFVGGKDDVVTPDAKFGAMCKQLKADRIDLPDADHNSAVDEAAKWLSANEKK